MKNPIANINMKNGSKVVIELRPDIAYNEVCSLFPRRLKGILTIIKYNGLFPVHG